MADEPMFEVVMSVPEMQRLASLVHTDLARVEGNMVIAQRKLDAHNDPSKPNLTGTGRTKALKVMESCPLQAAVLRGAQEALSQALSRAREKGAVR